MSGLTSRGQLMATVSIANVLTKQAREDRECRDCHRPNSRAAENAAPHDLPSAFPLGPLSDHLVQVLGFYGPLSQGYRRLLLLGPNIAAGQVDDDLFNRLARFRFGFLHDSTCTMASRVDINDSAIAHPLTGSGCGGQARGLVHWHRRGR